jgi:hypothetical protein
MSRSKPTKLDAQVIGDHQLLAQAIESLIHANPRHQRNQRRIVRLQSALKGMTSPEAWTAFVGLESAINDRAADIQEELVCWSFKAGVQAEKLRKIGSR